MQLLPFVRKFVIIKFKNLFTRDFRIQSKLKSVLSA